MALIILGNGKRKFLSPGKAANLWRILNGEVVATEKQVAICRHVKKVYLNWYNAPESYRRRYPERKPDYDEPVRVGVERWIPIETRKDLV